VSRFRRRNLGIAQYGCCARLYAKRVIAFVFSCADGARLAACVEPSKRDVAERTSLSVIASAGLEGLTVSPL
jgi:hypothetical protein